MHKLAAIICVIASLPTTEASSAAFEETAVNKLCKVASALMAVPKFFEEKQIALQKQITAGNDAAIKALLAATTTRKHNETTVYTAVAIAALNCAEEATKKLTDLVPPAVKAMTNAAKAAGGITEFAEFLRKVSIGRSTGYCLSTGTTVTTAKNAQDLGCPADVQETWTDAETLLQSEFSDKGFKNVNTANAKAAGASNKCPSLKGAADVADSLWKTNTPGPQNFFAGFATATPHNSQGSETIVIDDRTNKATSWKIPGATDTPDKIYNLISDLRSYQTGNCAETADELLTQVIASGAAQEIIGASLAPQDNTGKAVDVQTVANDMITSVAGDTDQRGEKIKEKINSVSVPQVTNGKTTMKKLKDEKDSKQHRYSLLPQQQSGLAALKSLEERVAATGRKAESSETETIDTCEAKGTGDNCKDGCKVEGEGDKAKCVKDPNYKPPQAEGTKEYGKKEKKCSDKKKKGDHTGNCK